jgi:hypothetical protein
MRKWEEKGEDPSTKRERNAKSFQQIGRETIRAPNKNGKCVVEIRPVFVAKAVVQFAVRSSLRTTVHHPSVHNISS